ncbi:hypothetical protein J6590_008791 [Homalodisca vitripennis]|nr:hypothetical protein J6590_008791 [Homalodisca vitripennis]
MDLNRSRPLLPNLTHPEYPVTPEAEERTAIKLVMRGSLGTKVLMSWLTWAQHPIWWDLNRSVAFLGVNPLGLSRNGFILNMREGGGCRMFLELHSPRVVSDLLSLSTSVSSQIMGLITGHGHLRKHLHRVGSLREDPLCRMCDKQEFRQSFDNTIFGTFDKGGKFPQEDLIDCFRWYVELLKP